MLALALALALGLYVVPDNFLFPFLVSIAEEPLINMSEGSDKNEPSQDETTTTTITTNTKDTQKQPEQTTTKEVSKETTTKEAATPIVHNPSSVAPSSPPTICA